MVVDELVRARFAERETDDAVGGRALP